MGQVNCAIIGYGYWGPNLVRNFAATPDCHVHTVADLSQDRLNAALKAYPNLNTSTDISSVIQDPAIDCVVIATPVFTHFELVKKALLAGKHVLLEKPITDTVAHADEIINLALQKGKPLTVAHTFLNTAVRCTYKPLITSGDFGKFN